MKIQAFVMALLVVQSFANGIEPEASFLGLWVLNYERAESVVVYRWEKGKKTGEVVLVEYAFPKGKKIEGVYKRKSTDRLHEVGDFEIVFFPPPETVDTRIPAVVLEGGSKDLVDAFVAWCHWVNSQGKGLLNPGKSSTRSPENRK